MRELDDLNINEGGNPVTRLAPTDELFEAFQSETGLPVPQELRSLLKYANGGCPELDTLSGTEQEFAVDHFFHLTPDDRGTESMWYGALRMRPVLGDKALPFASTGGGDQFFLDLSAHPPAVKLWLHYPESIVEISPTFAGFIDSLAINPDFD